MSEDKPNPYQPPALFGSKQSERVKCHSYNDRIFLGTFLGAILPFGGLTSDEYRTFPVLTIAAIAFAGLGALVGHLTFASKEEKDR